MFRRADRLLSCSLWLSAALSGSLVLLIAAFVLVESWPALTAVGIDRFLYDPSWHPAGGPEVGSFNLMPMLLGTLLTTLGAIVLAAPLGVLSAIFRRVYAPPLLGRAYRWLIELLAGIPSVVYGFWGLVVVVPILASFEPPGASLLAGILILTLMILPTTALTSDAALASVPRRYLEGAAALGLSRWATLRGVVLPAAGSGIGTGILLAIGRALGETMAVLMVCGNVVAVPDSLFAPVRTLTANIALEMAYALEGHRSALFVSGLLLLLLVSALVLAADALERRAVASEGGAVG